MIFCVNYYAFRRHTSGHTTAHHPWLYSLWWLGPKTIRPSVRAQGLTREATVLYIIKTLLCAKNKFGCRPRRVYEYSFECTHLCDRPSFALVHGDSVQRSLRAPIQAHTLVQNTANHDFIPTPNKICLILSSLFPIPFKLPYLEITCDPHPFCTEWLPPFSSKLMKPI